MNAFSVFRDDVRLGLLLDGGDVFQALSRLGDHLGWFKTLDSATRALVQAAGELDDTQQGNVTLTEGECLVRGKVAEGWCAVNVNVTLHRGRRVTDAPPRVS